VMLAYSALKFCFRGFRGSGLEPRPAVENTAASARESCEEEAGAPKVLALFLGILAGVLLGSIPLPVAGLPAPIRLGPAGGPIIAAIFLGRLRRLGPLDFTLSRGANALLREIGITLFMACVGLTAGEGFFDVLRNGPGLRWIAWGAFLTLVPTLLVGAAARRIAGLDSARVGGLLAGSSTNPPALSFAADREGSEEPSIAYATVYPLTMILRILSAQVLALFFFR
jgi:putative transport protein